MLPARTFCLVWDCLLALCCCAGSDRWPNLSAASGVSDPSRLVWNVSDCHFPAACHCDVWCWDLCSVTQVADAVRLRLDPAPCLSQQQGYCGLQGLAPKAKAGLDNSTGHWQSSCICLPCTNIHWLHPTSRPTRVPPWYCCYRALVACAQLAYRWTAQLWTLT